MPTLNSRGPRHAASGESSSGYIRIAFSDAAAVPAHRVRAVDQRRAKRAIRLITGTVALATTGLTGYMTMLASNATPFAAKKQVPAQPAPVAPQPTDGTTALAPPTDAIGTPSAVPTADPAAPTAAAATAAPVSAVSAAVTKAPATAPPKAAVPTPKPAPGAPAPTAAAAPPPTAAPTPKSTPAPTPKPTPAPTAAPTPVATCTPTPAGHACA